MFSLGAFESAMHRIALSQSCRLKGAILQGLTKPIPPASINSKSVSYCSCAPSLPKHELQTSWSSLPRLSSTESCSKQLVALPSCLETKRSLHLSNLSCTCASTPLLKSSKTKIDRSLVPELLEKDLIEVAIKGWGPGGQAVNKTNNAVFLKHVPTGLFVKVHKHRMRHKNSLEARQLLLDKLDDLVNGPMSVPAQEARLLEKRSAKNDSKGRKMRDLKAQWKQAQEGADAATSEDCLRNNRASHDGLEDASEVQDGFRDESGSFDSSGNKSGGGCAGSEDRLINGDGEQGKIQNKKT